MLANQTNQKLVEQDSKQVAIHHVPQNTGLNLPSENEWKHILSICDIAVRSGMLPNSVKTKEAAAIIALKARELNLPFMVGFSQIFVVSGKPSMSAELIQSLARRNLPGLVINILETSSSKCTVEGLRPERGSKPITISWTIDDARAAGLLSNDPWKKYPSAMLRARAITALLRILCPDSLMGISYTPEELGAEVDEVGSVIETTSRSVESSPEPLQSPIKEKIKGPSAAQLSRLFAIAKSKGMTSKDEVKHWIINTFDYANDFSLTTLTALEYDAVCSQMEKITNDTPQYSDQEVFQEDLPIIVQPVEPPISVVSPNAVPAPGLSEEQRTQWFKNRIVS